VPSTLGLRKTEDKTSYLGQLSFPYPSGVGKSSTGLSGWG